MEQLVHQDPGDPRTDALQERQLHEHGLPSRQRAPGLARPPCVGRLLLHPAVGCGHVPVHGHEMPLQPLQLLRLGRRQRPAERVAEPVHVRLPDVKPRRDLHVQGKDGLELVAVLRAHRDGFGAAPRDGAPLQDVGPRAEYDVVALQIPVEEATEPDGQPLRVHGVRLHGAPVPGQHVRRQDHARDAVRLEILRDPPAVPPDLVADHDVPRLRQPEAPHLRTDGGQQGLRLPHAGEIMVPRIPRRLEHRVPSPPAEVEPDDQRRAVHFFGERFHLLENL